MAASLLVRFPKLRAPSVSWPVIPIESRDAYPDLTDDFAVLDRVVAAEFTDTDLAALRCQNRYRRQQVLILLGATLVAGLGGLQAVFPSQRWPGVVLAVLGIALAASTRFSKEEGSQADYLSARIKAERLRALHFRYLAQVGPYASPDREIALRRAVVAIKDGREPK